MVSVTDKYPYRLALFRSCLWSHYLFHWRDANFHLFTESLHISADLLISMIQYLIIISFIIWYSLCLLYYPRLKSCLKGSVFLVLFVKIITCKCWASCMCYNDMLQEMLMTWYKAQKIRLYLHPPKVCFPIAASWDVCWMNISWMRNNVRVVSLGLGLVIGLRNLWMQNGSCVHWRTGSASATLLRQMSVVRTALQDVINEWKGRSWWVSATSVWHNSKTDRLGKCVINSQKNW